MTSPLGRYAPSPSGNQHLGNVFVAIVSWAYPHQRGGRCALRIDDLDGPRVRPESESSICEELAWLGLTFDPGPNQHPACRQSLRSARYRAVHGQLLNKNASYECFLSRKEWLAAASAPHGETGPIVQDRVAVQPLTDKGAQRPPAWRFKSPFDVINFTDQNQGLQSSSVDDFVVWRRDGIASYHLACIVDDHDLGVTEVLRGADLVPSTFRQLALYRTLDWKEPDYLHLPLVVTEAGERLEKRHGLPGIAALRDRGLKPETLYGWVLSALTGQNMTPLSQQQFIAQLPSPPWRCSPVVVPEALR